MKRFILVLVFVLTSCSGYGMEDELEKRLLATPSGIMYYVSITGNEYSMKNIVLLV